MKLKNFAAAAICATAGAFAAPAMANTVTYDITGVAAGTKTDILALLDIKQFDSALGLLTKVEIDYGSHVTGQVVVSNSSLKKDKTADFSLSATMTLTGPSGLSLTDTGSLFNAASVTAFKNTSNVVGKTGFADLAADTTLTSGFGSYLGTGNASAQLSIVASSGSSGQTIDNIFTTWGNGAGHVTYTFTAAPVPEPETYGMLLLGMGVVAFAAKRKSRSAQA